MRDDVYRHTQKGTVVRVCMLMAIMLCVVIGVFSANMPWGARLGLLGITLFLVLLTWLFGSLTVEVDDDELRHWFGPGFWRKAYPLHDIDSAEPVRNHWIYGWGIRLTPGGWLYNVSGLEAVQVQLRTGRRFRIGTDDPDGLSKAIAAGIA
ncbi:MAG: hypothetical protein QGH76_09240 [Phycisphaerales bacterium]|nr:hypothetical protein [Phycisphaerales bacterium]